MVLSNTDLNLKKRVSVVSVSKIDEQLKLMFKNAIKKAYDVEDVDVEIMIPKEKQFGDYSSNVAMKLTKVLHDRPQNIASKIIENIDLKEYGIKKFDIVGPGFINIFVDENVIASLIATIIKSGSNYGKSTYGEGKSYNVEFVSANPTGDLHLGHARQAALGDSMCRLLAFAGFKVAREYYINDLGNQINNLTLSVIARYNELLGLTWEFPENGYRGKDIIGTAQVIIDEIGDKYKGDTGEEAFAYFKKRSTELKLDAIKKVLDDFRCHFDIWTSEKENKDKGLTELALDRLKAAGYVYEADDATWLATTKFSDDKDRVLIKSDGDYTYFAPDIGYHADKLNRGYDYLVDLLGADHHGYINRMKSSLQMLGYTADTLHIEIVQMVRLIKDGEELKMSKRTGNGISIQELCEEIGTDAVRYFFVARAASSHLDFDMDLATSKSNDNPVYYAQYAYARICSILNSAKEQGFVMDENSTLINNEKEIQLLKQLNEFPSLVVDSAISLAPSKICNYIQKVAQLFHGYYGECRVIDQDNISLSSQRLALLEATRIVLQNAFNLIAIECKEKM